MSDEVGPERSLLVLCTAFRGKADRYPNLTVKKIPKQVLSRCEWGHDDYSLQVENLPQAPPKNGAAGTLFEEEEWGHEPPRQRHRRPPEPAPAAAPLAGDPRPHHGDRAAAERRRRAGSAGAIRSEFPSVTDFEREFPSLCFALATGVGKTRLMGAFISYLHLAHGINNFFVLAPNLTIYNKLIADFTPNTPKYVFKGIAEFATDAPAIITGDNYESEGGHAVRRVAALQDQHLQHLEDQLRGARRQVARASSGCRSTSARAISITWPGLPDLVLLMDESHRYRAVRRHAGDQRAEADAGPGADGDAVRGDRARARCRSRT